MIVSFRHRGLQRFYETGTLRGIQAAHADKLNRVLGLLNIAVSPQDLAIPGFKLHRLAGERVNYWSVWVNGNWRVIFRFVGTDVELVDYLDYH